MTASLLAFFGDLAILYCIFFTFDKICKLLTADTKGAKLALLWKIKTKLGPLHNRKRYSEYDIEYAAGYRAAMNSVSEQLQQLETEWKTL